MLADAKIPRVIISDGPTEKILEEIEDLLRLHSPRCGFHDWS